VDDLMARNFDGTNDSVNFGSDASVDAFANISFSFWIRRRGGLGNAQITLTKSQTTASWGLTFNTANKLEFARGMTGTAGKWIGSTVLNSTSDWVHIGVSYNNAVASDPIFYVNGVAESMTETQTPSGSAQSDAANNLLFGESSGGVQDLNADVQDVCFDNTIWTPQMFVIAMHWGAPKRNIKMWQRFLAADLSNKGTATAAGTATGSTLSTAQCPKVERCWASMMGCGR
jgi:hypothetical protein